MRIIMWKILVNKCLQCMVVSSTPLKPLSLPCYTATNQITIEIVCVARLIFDFPIGIFKFSSHLQSPSSFSFSFSFSFLS